jgi:CRISPR-associated protein Cmr2
MKTDFEQHLLAYLHDPPDKALFLYRHGQRAKKYASDVTGKSLDELDFEIVRADDIKASVEDRLPLPKYKDNKGEILKERTVFFNQEPNWPFHHPLSGEVFELFQSRFSDKRSLRKEPVMQDFLVGVRELNSDEKKFLALWRFYPEIVSKIDPTLEFLPAETRVPDHTLWNHLDLTAAFTAARSDGKNGSLLCFWLGPVQNFIEQAKSLRDLWSGSYLLSWLTFAAMKPIMKKFGPTAFIFPNLRENPLCDAWLLEKLTGSALIENNFNRSQLQDQLQISSLPNTFLVLVPESCAEDIAGIIKSSVREEWEHICSAVRSVFSEKINELNPGKNGHWDAGWKEQVEGFWETHVADVSLIVKNPENTKKLTDHFGIYLWPNCWPLDLVESIDHTMNATGDGYKKSKPGSWAMHVELVRRLLFAQKQIRQIPPHTLTGGDRPKCTLMGTFEQMGPGNGYKTHTAFWDKVSEKNGRTKSMHIKGTHIRLGERLCAVGLVKRFCWAAYFSEKFRQDPRKLRFSDTASVAAREWLEWAGIEPDKIREREENEDGIWNGQWVFQSPDQWKEQEENPKKESEPPPPPFIQNELIDAFKKTKNQKHEGPCPYYTTFVLDGDEMGKWLRGEKAPPLNQTYHSKLVRYFESISIDCSPLLKKNRPLSPAQHAAMTTALGNFSQKMVPVVVQQHKGELVYSGGDDALGVLPTRQALSCLSRLREIYSGRGCGDIPQGWEVKNSRLLLLMGKSASLSGGLAVAHFKTDLRDVLQAARDAEHEAKQSGRDALGIAVLKRSGEHLKVVCPWDFVPSLERFVAAFKAGASDRWSYRLSKESETLCSLPEAAVESAIKQVVDHGETASLTALACALAEDPGADHKVAGVLVSKLFRKFKAIRDSRVQLKQERAFSDFITLIQVASFLARGREVRS